MEEFDVSVYIVGDDVVMNVMCIEEWVYFFCVWYDLKFFMGVLFDFCYYGVCVSLFFGVLVGDFVKDVDRVVVDDVWMIFV